ncbi:MAG: YdeI/OmpD-associated family protein [Candidatus Cloacimonetes bacterium]|nr:YdeI/OmpD-associated family protein [Candidatus Cloacimonadota bacterium]HQB98820.1 YdeI/OmpD-associated family protein [Candidatus Cloacimonadota bacterium]
MKQKDFSNYPNRISLEVELKSEPQYPNSAYIVFDFDVEAVFGTKGRIPVVMTIDGKKFQRNLARYAGEYMMVFNKELRDETGYRAGDRVQILLERDQEERRVQIPEDIMDVMRETGVLPAWEKQSYSHQKEHIDWILDAKKDETKERRIDKLINLLKNK